MRYLQKYNDYNRVDEGWKENLLVAFTLATNVAFSNPPQSNMHKIVQIEQSIKDSDEKDFFSACLQLCEELKKSDLSFEQRRGLVEAQLYFQSMRDGSKSDKLSDEGIASVKSVESLLMKMSNDEVQRLASIGKTAQVSAQIVGR